MGTMWDACIHHMHAHCSMTSVTDTVKWVPKTVRVMVRLAMGKESIVYNYLELLYCLIGGMNWEQKCKSARSSGVCTEMEHL